MSDPKGEKPDSDHPHEDDLSLELHLDHEGPPAGDEAGSSSASSLNASTEEFHFSGPAEELDFTEPADFAFPSEQPAAADSGSQSASDFHFGEHAEAEPGVETPEGTAAESYLPDEAGVESELAGDGIADLEAAEEEKPKPKFELPAWVRTAEWITIGVVGVGALLAVVISTIWVKDPKHVTLALNIGCPLMLALIPYSLWRSSARWVTPAASAVYTVMLALSAAALIAGTWFEGSELSRYDWQYSKTRVSASKPRPPVAAPTPPVEPDKVEPAPAPPAPPKSSTEPAAK